MTFTNMIRWVGRRKIRLLFIVVLLTMVMVNALAALHAWRLTRFVDYGEARPVPEKMSVRERAVFALTGGFSPKSRVKGKPKFPHEAFTVDNSDGLTLHGWKSAGQSDTSGTVILCHGHGASRSALLAEAESFYDLGMRVVLFDFRAHGSSAGEVCSIGYYEADDVKAVWDYATAAHPGETVLLYGVSMGAVAAARAVAVYKLDPAAIVLDMPFDRLINAVQSRLIAMDLPPEPAATLLTFWGGVHLGYWGFGHSTADYVKAINSPILLQWGTEDARVSERKIDSIELAATNGNLRVVKYNGIQHHSLRKNAELLWMTSITDLLDQALTNDTP